VFLRKIPRALKDISLLTYTVHILASGMILLGHILISSI
jgi:hypothetical protein